MFPHEAPGARFQRIEVVVVDAHVDDALIDRGRRADFIFSLENP
jgi:hypothetical protein